MPVFQYGVSDFERDRGNLPELPVLNMFVEKAPTEDNVVLQSRPGLESASITMGSGGISALFQNDGVLSGELYGISGGRLYKNATDLGAIDGSSGYGKIAGFENRVFATRGQSLYQYDGATLAAVATPGSFTVRSLCVLSSRLVVINKNTGKFYWSDVLSPTIDALSFATAEYSPDQLYDCLPVGDTLVLFGSKTVEFWPASAANPDLPFQPMVGRTFNVGIAGTDCATKFGPSFAWITDEYEIAVGDPSNVISYPGLTERIEASNLRRLWRFFIEGTEFLALSTDEATHVFSQRSSQWSEFKTEGWSSWIARSYANGYFGHASEGEVLQWSAAHADYDATSSLLERRFRAGLPITSGTEALYSVELKANTGRTPYSEPSTYATPEVMLRTSDDGGESWSSWRTISLGTAGQYRKNLRWTSLGFFGTPGILVEIKVTDPVPFRISGLMANDKLATV